MHDPHPLDTTNETLLIENLLKTSRLSKKVHLHHLQFVVCTKRVANLSRGVRPRRDVERTQQESTDTNNRLKLEITLDIKQNKNKNTKWKIILLIKQLH